MTDEQVNEFTPNADELAILLNREDIKAKLAELGEGVSGLIQGTLDAVSTFLKGLGD